MAGNFDSPEYSAEELNELEEIIKKDLASHEASERVASAPEEGSFVVYGKSSDGVIIYDNNGIKTVVDKVPIGTFGSKSEAQSFANLSSGIIESGSGAVEWWDGMTGVEVDTNSASNTDQLLNDLHNSSLLQNMLTSNSPVINVPMLMEEVCKIVVPLIEDYLDGKECQIKMEALKAAWQKALKTISRMIVAVAYSALQNVSQKLRRMAAEKVRGLLDEYTSDACLTELNKGLDNFQNPDNLLSIDELCSTFEDTINDTMKELGETTTVLTTTAAAAWNKVTTAFDAMNGDIDAKKQMVNAMNMAIACATEFACARAKSFSDSKLQTMVQTVSDSIKKTMQGCLFQQALKSTKQFAPDSIPADVMNRVSNLAQNGEMMDAYNTALAAGIDLRGAPFRIQMPSSNNWVTDIYGDPYLFAPEKPSNAQQVADYITASLPSPAQMLNGTVTQEQLSDPAISKYWTDIDQKAASVRSTLFDQVAYKEDVISGMQSTGKSVEFFSGVDGNGESVFDADGNLVTSKMSSPVVKAK